MMNLANLKLSVPRNTTAWKLGGAKTLRLASAGLFSSSELDGYGTNLTNIEKSARRMYWSDGINNQSDIEKVIHYLANHDLTIFTEEELQRIRLLVQVDQAGAEALIVAYLCKAGRFRDLFIYGVKPHVFVAMHVFLNTWKIKTKDIDVDTLLNTPIQELKSKAGFKELDAIIRESDNWKSTERYYFFAKQMCHSLNYGCGEFAFRMNVLEKSRGRVVLSKKQAQDYIIKYHELFPEIHEWHRDIENELKNTFMLFNMQGFPIQYTGPSSVPDSILKEWYAVKPQSTVGCITHEACADCQEHIEDNHHRWDVLINNHDSLLGQAPIGEEHKLGALMKKSIERELTNREGTIFRMKSEAQCGMNWMPYHASKNPEGLRELTI